MKSQIFLVLWFSLVTFVKGPLPYRIPTNCRDGTVDYSKYLGILTPYRMRANLDDSPIKLPGCKLLKIFMVIRHGTKLPGMGLKERVNKDLEYVSDHADKYDYRATICAKELEAIRSWTIDTLSYQAKKLSPEGEEEMTELGERTRDRFPDFFPFNYYNPDEYEFRFGRLNRANTSYFHFAMGLFGKRMLSQVRYEKPVFGDPYLLFDKTCNKWITYIRYNKTATERLALFEKGDEMQEVYKQLATRLALRQDDGRITRTLTLRVILNMYKACGIGIAVNELRRFQTMDDGENQILSPWCNVFSEASMKTLEYYKDFKHYVVDGYAHDLTRKIPCVLVNHIIERLDAKISDVDQRKFYAYFIQAGAFLKLLTSLKLYRDSLPLDAFNMDMQADRKWRTSYLAPYGASLTFVLFECNGKRKIMLMHLEREIAIPDCGKPCNFEKFKNMFYTRTGCNHTEMCSGVKKTKPIRKEPKFRMPPRDEF